MRFKIIGKIILGIFTLGIMLNINITSAYATNIPYVNNQGSAIFANGVPILIEAGSNGKTKIRYYDGSKYIDWIERDYSGYSVYGGTGYGSTTTAVESSSITMTGGTVGYIYMGGKGKLAASDNRNVKGNADLVMSGGKVSLILSGGDESLLGGSANVKITGGDIGNIRIGGGGSDKVNGNIDISVLAGNVGRVEKGSISTVLGKKTAIITSVISDEVLFDNGFLKISDNNYIVKGNVTLPSEFKFNLPVGATLTIRQGSIISNNGEIIIQGNIENNGTFINSGKLMNDGGSTSGTGSWEGDSIEQLKYTLNLSSKTVSGESVSTELTGAGEHEPRKSVAISAPVVAGYNFEGWYQASSQAPGYQGSVLSKNRDYSFTIDQNKELVAVYKPLGTASVVIDGGNFYIDGVEYTGEHTGVYPLGKKMTVEVKDSTDFLGWINDYGKLVSREKNYSFTLTGPVKLIAQYNQKVDNKSTVIFESVYGQILQKLLIGVDDELILPDEPYRHGYDFIGWSINEEQIKNKISLGEAVIRVTPKYELVDQTYTVSVSNGEGTDTYKQNDIVEAIANEAEEGTKFSHWSDDNGKIVSYNKIYKFYASKDISIIANYVSVEIPVEEKGTAEIISVEQNTGSSKLIFVAMATVPEGCKINMSGIIATNKADIGTSNESFDKNSADYIRGNSWDGNAYRFTWIKKANSGETWYVRAYLEYEDKLGNLNTVYSDTVSSSL